MPRIFPIKRKSRIEYSRLSWQEGGFALIEVMVVLVILAALASFSFEMFFRKENIKTSVRKITNNARELKNFAKLEGRIYRLVIDLGGDEFGSRGVTQEGGGSTWWIEESNLREFENGLPDASDKGDKAKAEEGEDEKKSPGAFTPSKRFTKKPIAIAGGWSFVSVETSLSPDPITKGRAYIYFYPQGFNDEAVIQIKADDKNTVWSVYFKSLVGQALVFTEKKRLREFAK